MRLLDAFLRVVNDWIFLLTGGGETFASLSLRFSGKREGDMLAKGRRNVDRVALSRTTRRLRL